MENLKRREGLKTLKDLDEGNCEDCAREYGSHKGLGNYSKLVSQNQLRDEAKRWVEILDRGHGMMSGDVHTGIIISPNQCPTVAKFIKYFFNLED